MSKTLLDAVNEILKRVRVIAGDAGELTTLTDGSRQGPIDIAVQVVNEGIDALYTASATPLPNEQAESTVTLIAATRAYTLASDLLQLRWPMIDKTNNQYLVEAPGGYNALLLMDAEQDDTGLPHWACIRPTDGKLFLDRAPTAIEAGRIYTYQYDKDLALSTAAAVMPFSDGAFRAMVPAWVQLWKREMNNEFDGDLFSINVGRAAQFMSQQQMRQHYSPRG